MDTCTKGKTEAMDMLLSLKWLVTHYHSQHIQEGLIKGGLTS